MSSVLPGLSTLRLALVLGLLSCIGPFAIDMYLPALPAIGADLGAGVPAMQGTISAYFLAFGIAQLVYGPWADQAGRKPPMYAGVAIFAVGTVICALAPSVTVLTAGRVVQGLGGAALMVIPRAVIRDVATGHAATRLMASVMLVISVSPMLAPLAGSGVLAVADWRWIFGLLAVASGLSLTLAHLALPETLAPALRQPFDPATMRRGVARLFGDRRFLALTGVGGFGMASFFVFIASGPFVYTQAFGLSPTQFSLAFAVNAIGFFAASQVAAPLGQRFGAAQVVRAATVGFAAVALGLLAIALSGGASLPVTMAGLFAANAFIGLFLPTTMVLALDSQGDNAGLASSVGGTMQMLAGGLTVAATGPFFDGSVAPMIAAIAACGVVALGLALLAGGTVADPARRPT